MITRCMIFFGIFLLTVPVQADTDFTVNWVISGIEGFSELKADLDVGANTISLDAGLGALEGGFIPVSGTCLLNSIGGVNCSLELGSQYIVINVDETLSGDIAAINNSLSPPQAERGKVFFQSLVTH